MAGWLLKLNTESDTVVRSGVIAIALAASAKDFYQQLKPSAELNAVVSLLMSLLLAWPVVARRNHGARDLTLTRMMSILSIAYGFTGLLYFLSAMANWPPSGFDAVTDLLGTLLYVAAWFVLSSREEDTEGFTAERTALPVIVVIAILFASLKTIIDLRMAANPDLTGGESQRQAARLVLNICNGAVLFSLYGLMRRLLLQPDPLSHVVIALYACAQIAAHGRDCLKDNACPPGSVESITALGIAWALLLGKISFGLYVLYLYFNATFSPPGPVDPTTSHSVDTATPPQGGVATTA